MIYHKNHSTEILAGLAKVPCSIDLFAASQAFFQPHAEL
jgi:hypothetical protein